MTENHGQKKKKWQVNWIEQVAWPATLLKKRIWHKCFPVNFAKFLRTRFVTEHPGGCFWTYLFLSLLEKTAWKLKRRLIKELLLSMLLLYTRIFSTLKHLSFFKTKLVSHSIKARSHCNFSKPFLVYVVKIIERAILKKVS